MLVPSRPTERAPSSTLLIQREPHARERPLDPGGDVSPGSEHSATFYTSGELVTNESCRGRFPNLHRSPCHALAFPLLTIPALTFLSQSCPAAKQQATTNARRRRRRGRSPQSP